METRLASDHEGVAGGTTAREVAPVTAALWEREGAFASIEALADRLDAGHPSVLFIAGEAGLGKTTLLEHAVARLANARVGWGRACEMEGALAYGVIHPVLADLGRQSGGAFDATDLLAAPGSPSPNFYRVLQALERLAADAPVLLALDDLHWADPDSLALLSFLCRRLGPVPIGVIATLRPWPPAAAQLCASLVGEGRASLERLAPLSQEGVSAMMSAGLGTPVAAPLVAQAWHVTGGNPLLIQHVGMALAQGETLPSDNRRVPRLGKDLLLTRFAAVSAPALRAAQAAAVLGAQFRSNLVAEVAGLDDADGDQALEELYRSGLVVSADAGLARFAHPVFRQALYDDMVPSLRSRLHARAFRLYEQIGDVAVAASHALAADLVGDPDAIAVVTRAGNNALRERAFGTAVSRLRGAVRLAGPAADVSTLAALGEGLWATGRSSEAISAFLEVVERPGLDTDSRCDAVHLLGRAQHSLGEYA
ncbi:MAG TPA: AAA family ATPase, partial [Acidimicrobiales bacterium]|nr:AAA family ATPase [Acidimicrobiales bacterium]